MNKITQKIMLSSLLLGTSSLAFANGGVVEPPHHAGYFYGGVFLGSDFGIVNARTNFPITVVDSDPTGLFQFTNSLVSQSSWSAAGFDGGLLAGYNFLFTHFNLGLEGTVEGSTARGISNQQFLFTNNLINFSQSLGLKSKIEMPFSAGISILPAYELSHGTAVLARVGVKFTDFRYTAVASERTVPSLQAEPDFTITSIRTHQFEPGIQYGLGLQSAIVNAFDIRLEYDRTEYETFKRSSNPVILFNQDQFQRSTQTKVKLEPAEEQFKVALIYHPQYVNDINHEQDITLTNGFYLGVFGSRDIANIDAEVTHRYLDFFSQPPNIPSGNIQLYRNTQHFDWNADGYDGGGFIGYRQYFQQRYALGLEFSGEGSSLEKDYSVALTGIEIDPTGRQLVGYPNGKGKFDIKRSIGISVLPGIMLTDKTMLFANIGWVYSRFELSGHTTSFEILSSTVDVNRSQFLSRNPLVIDRDKSGAQVGLGLSTMLNQHIGLRMEYDARFYGKFGKSQAPVIIPNSTQLDGQGPIALDTSINVTPVVGRFSVAAVYHFS